MKKYEATKYYRVGNIHKELVEVTVRAFTKKGIEKKMAKSVAELKDYCDGKGVACTYVAASESVFRV